MIRKCRTRGCSTNILPGRMNTRRYCSFCYKERQRICSRDHKRRKRENPNYRNEMKHYMSDYYKRMKISMLKSQYERNRKLKISVLTHYGKNGILQCRWRNCPVSDVDCLTLDHVKNDGNVQRNKPGRGAGVSFFYEIVKRKFPLGLQTLCWNHQWKKEIAKRKKNRRTK
jgi:hypothetical protein